MGFYETPVRRLHSIRAMAMFGLAFAMSVLAWLDDLDALGRIFVGAGAALCLLFGVMNLRKARRLRSEPPRRTTNPRSLK